MHESSRRKVEAFRETHLAELTAQRLDILEVGSREVSGGSYRPLFSKDPWKYTGLDVEHGPGVDVVVKDGYRWKELEDNSFDVVVSGQCLEHVEYFWRVMEEIARVLKPGGLACIVVPSTGPVHRHPVDCWRFYQDGLVAMAKWAALEVVSAEVDEESAWRDAVLVARKPAEWRPAGLSVFLT